MRREYDFSKGKRGPVIKPAPGKTRITIRIDDAVLDWFRRQAHAAGGASYQTMINDALRDHVAAKREPLAETLRRVLREEMAAYRSARAVPRSSSATTSSTDTRAFASPVPSHVLAVTSLSMCPFPKTTT